MTMNPKIVICLRWDQTKWKFNGESWIFFFENFENCWFLVTFFLHLLECIQVYISNRVKFDFFSFILFFLFTTICRSRYSLHFFFSFFFLLLFCCFSHFSFAMDFFHIFKMLVFRVTGDDVDTLQVCDIHTVNALDRSLLVCCVVVGLFWFLVSQFTSNSFQT